MVAAMALANKIAWMNLSLRRFDHAQSVNADSAPLDAFAPLSSGACHLGGRVGARRPFPSSRLWSRIEHGASSTKCTASDYGNPNISNMS
jgi:hypothetical protein